MQVLLSHNRPINSQMTILFNLDCDLYSRLESIYGVHCQSIVVSLPRQERHRRPKSSVFADKCSSARIHVCNKPISALCHHTMENRVGFGPSRSCASGSGVKLFV